MVISRMMMEDDAGAVADNAEEDEDEEDMAGSVEDEESRDAPRRASRFAMVAVVEAAEVRIMVAKILLAAGGRRRCASMECPQRSSVLCTNSYVEPAAQVPKNTYIHTLRIARKIWRGGPIQPPQNPIRDPSPNHEP